eukprot:TRINITY_DN1261_c0_g1_i1.p1 TRINITY_DN1261_c0_g1~~TRINITY_DN1261_c0_g1_i1.p1  ORF type:complete len:132 (+),score=25.23 TRINITY_DN1261_c0_g1_i1:484-879(+)
MQGLKKSETILNLMSSSGGLADGGISKDFDFAQLNLLYTAGNGGVGGANNALKSNGFQPFYQQPSAVGFTPIPRDPYAGFGGDYSSGGFGGLPSFLNQMSFFFDLPANRPLPSEVESDLQKRRRTDDEPPR